MHNYIKKDPILLASVFVLIALVILLVVISVMGGLCFPDHGACIFWQLY